MNTELSAVAFFIEPDHRRFIQGKTKLLPAVRRFPFVITAGLVLCTAVAGLEVSLRAEAGQPTLPYVLFGIVCVGTAAALFKRRGPGALQAWRLSRHGKLLPGEVVYCAGTRNDVGELVVNMKFRFRTPDDRPVEGVQRFSGRRLPGESLPAPRTALAILYASDDCYQVL